MSRKSKTTIALPKGVEITVNNDAITVKGPKGTLTQELHSGVKVTQDDAGLSVTAEKLTDDEKGFLGLYWSLINNMVTGVSTGFSKDLELVGVGYRAAVQGRDLSLQLGFSHPTTLPIPEGVEVKVEKGTKVQVSGANKQVVGQFAAQMRALRKPEPYKGKGVHYVGEYVRRKAGKAAKAR